MKKNVLYYSARALRLTRRPDAVVLTSGGQQTPTLFDVMAVAYVLRPALWPGPAISDHGR